MKRKVFPDFLCIGVEKGGTTWLYEMLKQHPDIWLTPTKEIHYFDQGNLAKMNVTASFTVPSWADKIFKDKRIKWKCHLIDRIKTYVRHPIHLIKDIFQGKYHLIDRIKAYVNHPIHTMKNIFWYLKYFLVEPSDEWYGSLFSRNPQKISGEFTPDYNRLGLEHIARIKQLMPDLKIIFLLRNPIERTWSSLRMRYGSGNIDVRHDEEVFEFLDSDIEAEHSDYVGALKRWGAFFTKERLEIIFFEEIVEKPEALLQRVYRFLNVDDDPKNIPRNCREKVFSSPPLEMPDTVFFHLAEKYYTMLRELDARFGGHASNWLKAAECILKQKKAL